MEDGSSGDRDRDGDGSVVKNKFWADLMRLFPLQMLFSDMRGEARKT
jgi:hypothetical protein